MVIMRTPNIFLDAKDIKAAAVCLQNIASLSFSHHDVSNNEKKIDPSMKIKVLDHPKKKFGLLVK